MEQPAVLGAARAEPPQPGGEQHRREDREQELRPPRSLVLERLVGRVGGESFRPLLHDVALAELVAQLHHGVQVVARESLGHQPVDELEPAEGEAAVADVAAGGQRPRALPQHLGDQLDLRLGPVDGVVDGEGAQGLRHAGRLRRAEVTGEGGEQVAVVGFADEADHRDAAVPAGAPSPSARGLADLRPLGEALDQSDDVHYTVERAEARPLVRFSSHLTSLWRRDQIYHSERPFDRVFARPGRFGEISSDGSKERAGRPIARILAAPFE
ncbi:hypothetical protein V5P93_004917 [Actinokineospora auranticolor]|uniref:hypothetical protein n=1 Tax=Actinokineospora auranticolor TaxID=155976 RepID=UPI0011B014DE|nr:hypothetical protein [Actinokineospora auranticolor]